MTTGRETRMNKMRTDVMRSSAYGPKAKSTFLYNDLSWGKNRTTPMSQIKAQASNRKKPITLPKINLPE